MDVVPVSRNVKRYVLTERSDPSSKKFTQEFNVVGIVGNPITGQPLAQDGGSELVAPGGSP